MELLRHRITKFPTFRITVVMEEDSTSLTWGLVQTIECLIKFLSHVRVLRVSSIVFIEYVIVVKYNYKVYCTIGIYYAWRNFLILTKNL